MSEVSFISGDCLKYLFSYVWFEPTDISRAFRPFQNSAWRSAIAYASPNLNELKVMHDAILRKESPPLKADCLERKIEESIQLGIPLLNDALHTIIVTLSSHGILLISNLPENSLFPTKNSSINYGKVRAIHYPAPIPDTIISVSGAGDCFAAAMASAIIRGLDPEACVHAGQQAAITSLASHIAVPSTMSPNVVFFEKVPTLKKSPITVI